jgi:hypothetical protein
LNSQLIDVDLTTRLSKPPKSPTNSREPLDCMHPETQFKILTHSNLCDWLTHVARSSNFHSLNDHRHAQLPPFLSLRRGIVNVLTKDSRNFDTRPIPLLCNEH